jgi:cytochrome c553
MRSWVLTCVLSMGIASAPSWAADNDAGITFFETKIRPVLVEHCQKCHGDKKQRGEFRLDSKAAMLKGGESGKAMVPGQAEQSLIIKALRHLEPKMPPDQKLPDAVIADFVKWIDMGAPDPRDSNTVAIKKTIDWAEAKTFWSFQPPKEHAPPKVANEAWAKGPIDRFILAKLEEAKLQPVKAAVRRDLLRRASFDLIGLPPTPEEVDAFLQDDSPQAYEKVVERLLQSPHYGERWGRYWLDVARYAEDQAHTFGVKPNTSAWRYRDWVIQAFNDDMPYDRFVKLQLAADLIEKEEISQRKHVAALGFIGLGAQYYRDSPLTATLATADELDDRIDSVTRGFMGFTVSCARCHDHKFDPIPQVDYYSLAGVFSSCKLTDIPVAPKDVVEKFNAHQEQIKKVQANILTVYKDERRKSAEQRVGDVARYFVAAWQYQKKKTEDPKLLPKDFAQANKLEPIAFERLVKDVKLDKVFGDKSLAKEASEVDADAKTFEETIRKALADRDAKTSLGEPSVGFLRQLFGENGVFEPTEAVMKTKLAGAALKTVDGLKAEVTKLQKQAAANPLPAVHAVMEATPADAKINVRGSPLNLGDVAPRRFLRVLSGESAPRFSQGSGRLELADAIASPSNPLTARVIVNRVWQYHFGRGLVGTPSNFGQLGDRPSHPELLDDLTSRFTATGWSIKALHREIMLSATYQMSSDHDEANFARDGDNRLYWRMNRRRLDVEGWRDAMLAVSGKLDTTFGGPTINLSQDMQRRTVYAKISRHNLDSLLRLFDFPDANITSERRAETTVPQQQLFFMNSPFVTGMARSLAARMLLEKGDDAAKIERGYRLAYGRSAESSEIRDAAAFVGGSDDPAEQSNQLTRWERLAQVLIGSNEFLFVD